jgi:hypothetical protein
MFMGSTANTGCPKRYMQKTSGDLEIFAGMTAVVLWTHITKWVGNTNESP